MYHAVRRIPLLARNGIRAAPLISSRSSTRGLLVSRQKGRICGAHFSSQHSSLHLARETKRNDDICAGAATHATPNVLHTSAATSASDVPFPLLSTADDVQRLLEDMFGPTVVSDLSVGVFHVTACYESPLAPGSYFTLKIDEQAPKSRWDWFILNTARATADACIITGQELRDEPHISNNIQDDSVPNSTNQGVVAGGHGSSSSASAAAGTAAAAPAAAVVEREGCFSSALRQWRHKTWPHKAPSPSTLVLSRGVLFPPPSPPLFPKPTHPSSSSSSSPSTAFGKNGLSNQQQPQQQPPLPRCVLPAQHPVFSNTEGSVAVFTSHQAATFLKQHVFPRARLEQLQQQPQQQQPSHSGGDGRALPGSSSSSSSSSHACEVKADREKEEEEEEPGVGEEGDARRQRCLVLVGDVKPTLESAVRCLQSLAACYPPALAARLAPPQQQQQQQQEQVPSAHSSPSSSSAVSSSSSSASASAASTSSSSSSSSAVVFPTISLEAGPRTTHHLYSCAPQKNDETHAAGTRGSSSSAATTTTTTANSSSSSSSSSSSNSSQLLVDTVVLSVYRGALHRPLSQAVVSAGPAAGGGENDVDDDEMWLLRSGRAVPSMTQAQLDRDYDLVNVQTVCRSPRPAPPILLLRTTKSSSSGDSRNTRSSGPSADASSAATQVKSRGGYCTGTWTFYLYRRRK